MDVDQAASRLRVTRQTIYNMIGDGRLGDYKIGNTRVLWAEEVRLVADALRMVRPPRG